jgi:signal transduction histidine kinase
VSIARGGPVKVGTRAVDATTTTATEARVQITRRNQAAAPGAAPHQEQAPATTPVAAGAPAAPSPAAKPTSSVTARLTATVASLREAQSGLDRETRTRRLLVGLLLPELLVALVLLFSGAFVGLVIAVLAFAVQVGVALLLVAGDSSAPAAAATPLEGVVSAQRVEIEGLRRGITEASTAVTLQVELSRRHQGLLLRQLGRIDELEAREADPAALGELFALDHLATRMRRCTEGVLVLSGAAPDPTDGPPVAASEVLRGAVAEIEDFNRVDVSLDRDVMLAGSCAVDLVHLLAELVENATVFSSPTTRVAIHGQVAPDGYVVTVADTGVGIEPDRAAAIAALLAAQSPALTPGQLGYQVAARLARRHGMVLNLAANPGGGTVVAVAVPAALVAGEARPARSGRSHARRATAPVPEQVAEVAWTAAVADFTPAPAGAVADSAPAWPGHEVPDHEAGLLPYVPTPSAATVTADDVLADEHWLELPVEPAAPLWSDPPVPVGDVTDAAGPAQSVAAWTVEPTELTQPVEMQEQPPAIDRVVTAVTAAEAWPAAGETPADWDPTPTSVVFGEPLVPDEPWLAVDDAPADWDAPQTVVAEPVAGATWPVAVEVVAGDWKGEPVPMADQPWPATVDAPAGWDSASVPMTADEEWPAAIDEPAEWTSVSYDFPAAHPEPESIPVAVAPMPVVGVEPPMAPAPAVSMLAAAPDDLGPDAGVEPAQWQPTTIGVPAAREPEPVALAWQPPPVAATGPAPVGRPDMDAAPFVAPAVIVPEQSRVEQPSDEVTVAGLRRRVPQANMAPQMQAHDAALPAEVAVGPAPDRSRHLLSAYRDGLVLGRSGLADAVHTQVDDRDRDTPGDPS